MVRSSRRGFQIRFERVPVSGTGGASAGSPRPGQPVADDPRGWRAVAQRLRTGPRSCRASSNCRPRPETRACLGAAGHRLSTHRWVRLAHRSVQYLLCVDLAFREWQHIRDPRQLRQGAGQSRPVREETNVSPADPAHDTPGPGGSATRGAGTRGRWPRARSRDRAGGTHSGQRFSPLVAVQTRHLHAPGP